MTYPKRSVAGLSLGVQGWIMVALMVVGLVLAVPAWVSVRKGWLLADHGVQVTGVVTALATPTRSCGKDNTDTCTDYDVSYDFPVGGGTRSAMASVAPSFYGEQKVGGAIEVRYLADAPDESEIDPGTTLIGGVALALLALAFVAVGGLGFGWRWRRARRMVWARDNGTQRAAVVVAKTASNVRVNNRQQWQISWRDAAGMTGKSRLRRQEDLPGQGENITIYADPDGVLPPIWEGDSGTR